MVLKLRVYSHTHVILQVTGT